VDVVDLERTCAIIIRELAIIININTTSTGAEVCELVIVYDKEFPDTVGEKRYTNQDYWTEDTSKTYLVGGRE
jgi:hypothetical protein